MAVSGIEAECMKVSKTESQIVEELAVFKMAGEGGDGFVSRKCELCVPGGVTWPRTDSQPKISFLCCT